jgi:hypothetical protein
MKCEKRREIFVCVLRHKREEKRGKKIGKLFFFRSAWRSAIKFLLDCGVRSGSEIP